MSFLSRIAYRKMIDVYRQRRQTLKHSRHRVQTLSPRTEDDAGDEPPGRQPTPSQLAIAEEQWDRLLKGQLPEVRRALEMLRLGHSHRGNRRLPGSASQDDPARTPEPPRETDLVMTPVEMVASEGGDRLDPSARRRPSRVEAEILGRVSRLFLGPVDRLLDAFRAGASLRGILPPPGGRRTTRYRCVLRPRFPSHQSALRGLLAFDRFLGHNPNFVPELPQEEIAWPTVGEECGDLTLLRPLGSGTFARVFLAAEASTGGRLVAVKFSKGGAAERGPWAGCLHPHIVPILSARLEESTGLTMVCMPYLGSTTLENLLDHFSSLPDEQRPRKAAVILDVLRPARSCRKIRPRSLSIPACKRAATPMA